ncbi:hypothetical protein [Burkholderia gladioli]|uniref:hypothetical protein n=1 Tax=Burkholderia gladioli TaxID=28095 RepID=UPI00163F0E18|nr:hypothetical protein [Burkholderia gladioli]
MVTYFLSRQSAMAMILDRQRSLAPAGETGPAGPTIHIWKVEQLLRDVRLGRQDEFVRPCQVQRRKPFVSTK